MSLVVISTSYPRFADDSAGGTVVASVAALINSGAQVEVIAPDDDPRKSPPGDAAATAWSNRVVTVRYAPLRRLQKLCYGAGIWPNLRARPLRGLLLPGLFGALWLAAWQRRDRPIIAHWLVPAALAAVLAGARRVVAVVHGSDLALLERVPGGQALARSLASRCLGIGCVSADLARRFATLVDGPVLNVAVLPPICNQIEPPDRNRARQQLDLPGQRPVVLFVGRLLASKGVDTLIDAFAQLPTPPLMLIAGDGPERKRLQQLAQAGAVDARFLGVVPPAQRDRLLAAADLVVVPSRPDAHGHAEGLPAVLLEAMAAGCPVIASNVGGIPDVLVDGETGWLVPPGDAAALATTLQRALADAPGRDRCGRAARRAAARWTPACHAAAVRALFEVGSRST